MRSEKPNRAGPRLSNLCAEIHPTRGAVPGIPPTSSVGSCPPELMTAVYDRLRAIASARMQNERSDHTLQPTALVHEAYLRLANTPDVKWSGPRQFYGAAAESMRRILIDHARGKNAAKRGGGEPHFQFDENMTPASDPVESAFSLNAALTELESRDPRMHEVVMLRYFAGRSVEETAELMEISPRTVKREWSVARLWLRARISEGRTD